MKENQRAAIAAVAVALTNNCTISSVYSYELATYITLSVKVTSDSVSIYDYSRMCSISGNSNGQGKFNLYDYGTFGYMTISINAGKIDGYDYVSGWHFSGTVRNNLVSIYDYETCCYYNFSC